MYKINQTKGLSFTQTGAVYTEGNKNFVLLFRNVFLPIFYLPNGFLSPKNDFGIL